MSEVRKRGTIDNTGFIRMVKYLMPSNAVLDNAIELQKDINGVNYLKVDIVSYENTLVIRDEVWFFTTTVERRKEIMQRYSLKSSALTNSPADVYMVLSFPRQKREEQENPF